MTDDMTAMSHENDGGLCWCGPKCGPSFPWRSDELQQLVDERLNDKETRDG